MSHRKRTPDEKPTESATEAASAGTSTAVAEPPAAANDNAPAVGDNQPSFAARVGQRQGVTAADPFGIAHDTIAGVRLFESKQDRQMALKFEEKPSQAVIDKLKEARWTWKPADKIWALPIWPASAMTIRINAERLYQDICSMIRQEKGIGASKEVPF